MTNDTTTTADRDAFLNVLKRIIASTIEDDSFRVDRVSDTEAIVRRVFYRVDDDGNVGVHRNDDGTPLMDDVCVFHVNTPTTFVVDPVAFDDHTRQGKERYWAIDDDDAVANKAVACIRRLIAAYVADMDGRIEKRVKAAKRAADRRATFGDEMYAASKDASVSAVRVDFVRGNTVQLYATIDDPNVAVRVFDAMRAILDGA